MADHRSLALALLNVDLASAKLSRKAGSFPGQCAVDATPLTDKQAERLDVLTQRAGMSAAETEAAA